MKRNLSAQMSFSLLRSLEKFGADIRIARLETQSDRGAARERASDPSLDLERVEAGDAMVALGIYAACCTRSISVLLSPTLADPRRDEHGLLLDLQRLPQRARVDRRRPCARPAVIRRQTGALRRIGVLGVMSGPAAPWGPVNQQCAEITAEMYNDAGGIDIDGERFKIEIRLLRRHACALSRC